MPSDDRRPLIDRLQDGKWRYVRIPVGVVCVIGGVFGFLPVVGFWMLPLGLSILAIDFPPARSALRWLEERGARMRGWIGRNNGEDRRSERTPLDPSQGP